MGRWKKAACIGAAVLVALLLFMAFALPPIIKSKAIKAVEQATGRTLAIGKIVINPLIGTVEVRGVKFSEKGKPAATFAAFSSVHARISPSSLWRRAPVIKEVRIRSPYLHIERTGANRYNFSDLLEKKGPEKEKPAGKPALFSLNNIIISNGTIEFLDGGLARPTLHGIHSLNVQVPFVSNIPYMVERYIDPKLSATVNGAAFSFTGKLRPFTKGMEASVSLNLKDLDLPYYAAYIPATLPLSVASGRLSTSLEITHRLVEGGKPDLTLAGSILLAKLALREPEGAPFASLERAEMKITKAGLMTGEYTIASLTVDSPEVFLSRDRKGTMSYARFISKEEQPKQEQPKQEKKPLSLALGKASIVKGAAHFSDSQPPGGFKADLRDITLDLADFATAGGKPATYSLAMETGRGEKFSVAGTLVAAPVSATAHLQWDKIVLEALHPYLADTLRAPINGRLSGATDLTFDEPAGLRLAGLGLQLQQFAVPFAKDEGVKIPLLELKGGKLDLKERKLGVELVAVKGGSIRASRDDKGALSPLQLLVQKPATPAAPAARKVTKGEKPFAWSVRNCTVNGLDLEFADGTKKANPRFALRKLNASLSGLSGPTMRTMPYRLATGYGKKGEIRSQGTVNPAPFSLKGSVSLKQIPITDAEPYLPEGLNIVLADGSIDTTMNLALAMQKDTLTGSFQGTAGVRQFYSLDAAGREDLLKWESLQLDGISGTLSPFSLKMSEVSLNNFYARLIVNRDGVINLQQIKGEPPKAAGAPAPQAAPVQPAPAPVATAAAPPAPPAAPAAAAAPSPVKIDAITLQGGTLAFTDRHLPSEFATTMYNLGGRISGLSSEEAAYADVDLRGNLENHSPLTITGKVNPLRGDLYADLKVRFTDIELSPATPYAGTYLGYGVDKGKLSLDLKYLIDRKKLESENKVLIDQLTFGQKVESAKATNLPVRLAVALLKDRQGVINLDLPVTGRTDDPKFSVWGVVFKILKNLLVKAATSPFALLSSMFGGGQDFSAVAFAPGSPRLEATETAKLRTLAKAFLDRPALKLEVTGFVDRERDAEGYRNELLLKKMRAEKFLAMVKEKQNQPGQTQESVEITQAEYPVYLKVVYKKEKFPKPRTIIGTLKDLPDLEMKKLILANTPVGDTELKALARERTAAVRTFLVGEGKLEPARIFEKGGDIYQSPKEEGKVASRVEFGVTAQ